MRDLLNQQCKIIRLILCCKWVKSEDEKIFKESFQQQHYLCLFQEDYYLTCYNINNKTLEMIIRFKTTEYDIRKIKQKLEYILYFDSNNTNWILRILSFPCFLF